MDVHQQVSLRSLYLSHFATCLTSDPWPLTPLCPGSFPIRNIRSRRRGERVSSARPKARKRRMRMRMRWTQARGRGRETGERTKTVNPPPPRIPHWTTPPSRPSAAAEGRGHICTVIVFPLPPLSFACSCDRPSVRPFALPPSWPSFSPHASFKERTHFFLNSYVYSPVRQWTFFRGVGAGRSAWSTLWFHQEAASEGPGHTG